MRRALAAGAASGLLVNVASPPVLAVWLLPVAFAPLMWALRGRGAAQWAAAGLAWGVCYMPSLPLGLLAFPPLALALFYFALLGWFAFVFGLAGAAEQRLPAALQPVALALTWTGCACAVDLAVYAPPLIGAPLALAAPRMAQAAWWWGAPALDGLLIALSVLPAALASRRGVLPAGIASGAAALVLAVSALAAGPTGETGRAGRVIVLQPDIAWNDFRSSGWSVMVRRSIEQRLDELTEKAAQSAERAVLIWPENGNGLANAQLARRRAWLSDVLRPGGHELLGAGKEVAEGSAHLAVFHFDAGGVRGRARKSHLVPIAEADLRAGAPAVLDTQAGRLGVAICYDSVFGSHFRRVVRDGAEAIAVTTDDASFGLSSLHDWHGAYSILHAIEAGRSLVFVSNSGPTWLYDSSRAEVVELMGEGEAGFREASVPLRQERSPAHRGLRHAIPLGSLLVLAACFARRAPQKFSLPRWRPIAIGAAVVLGLAPLSLALETAGVAWRRGVSLEAVLGDAQRRYWGYGAIDALGPLFKQTSETTCGAAALAFGLYALGDDVFEHDVVRASGQPGDDGMSLAQLRDFALHRGFEADGFSGSIEDLERLGQNVAILHLANQHFVVAWTPVGRQIHVFDPAIGRVMRMDADRLRPLWTGRFLRLRLPGFTPASTAPPLAPSRRLR